MSINSGEAFTIEEFGLALSDEDGNVLLYITTGVGSPMGTDAPVPSLYIQDDGTTWKKTAVGVNGWTQGDFEDQHAGIYDVSVGETVTIQLRKDMRVYRYMRNEGRVINNGRLVVI